jgi:hypothetical protein
MLEPKYFEVPVIFQSYQHNGTQVGKRTIVGLGECMYIHVRSKKQEMLDECAQRLSV